MENIKSQELNKIDILKTDIVNMQSNIDSLHKTRNVLDVISIVSFIIGSVPIMANLLLALCNIYTKMGIVIAIILFTLFTMVSVKCYTVEEALDKKVAHYRFLISSAEKEIEIINHRYIQLMKDKEDKEKADAILRCTVFHRTL